MTDKPLRDLLDGAAMSGQPVPRHELDELTVSDDLSYPELLRLRTRISRAGREIAALKQEGNHGPARALARDTALELSDQLAGPTPAPLPDDPAELAALIDRSGGPGTRPERAESSDPRSMANRLRSTDDD